MPQQEAERCRLIGGTYANVLQFVLGIAALTGLLVKRQQEKPRRPIKVWIYDVSKQGYGALFVHFWNIVMSMILADLSRRANADAVERDACALYFVQFVLDMMLGMVMIWAMVRTQEWLAERYVLQVYICESTIKSMIAMTSILSKQKDQQSPDADMLNCCTTPPTQIHNYKKLTLLQWQLHLRC
eukprot:TRINITY_DN10171_c0_g2_i2.p1 TRINITY_DN10171_c0_g2~~TRINITY_DN10171_c0_g2_i2.p1  ORF type:complete len:185 (-),score=17.10 TRINITY_DN10171_c0_g2_i2:1107-1661(-)